MDKKPEQPMVDIKRPSQSASLHEVAPPVSGSRLSELPQDIISRSSARLIAFFLLCALGTGVSVWGIKSFFEWRTTMRSISSVSEDFEKGTLKLQALDIAGARKSFLGAKTYIKDPPSISQSLMGKAVPAFKSGEEALNSFRELVYGYIALSEEISLIYKIWPAVLSGKESMIPPLAKISGNLRNLHESSGALASALSSIGTKVSADSGSYLGMQSDLGHVSSFVDNLLVWLKKERRILVIFEDSSVMRATGGKIIAYADVVIKDGKIFEIKVREYQEVDKTLSAKIIPPQPLQFKSARWRTSDANWFFDFGDSASKIISLLESRTATSSPKIEYDAALALSPKVFADILAVYGPIDLNGTEVASSSFQLALEKKAEWGKEGDLAKFFDALITFLRSNQSSPNRGADVPSKIFENIKSRDIMAYFKESDLEEFADYSESSGKVIPLSKEFYGDYLAIVDSSVGDGRTDQAIRESASLKSQIDSDGIVTNRLTINRLHRGGGVPWRNNTNIDYLRVLLPPEAQIDSYTGGSRRSFAGRNYDLLVYSVDPDLLSWNQSFHDELNLSDARIFSESGKKGFAGWIILDPGESGKISLDYHSKLPLAPADGMKYQFILEKQPGRTIDYSFEINAPVGFRFMESKLPTYEYKISNPPGRSTLNLTLERIER